MAVGRVRDVTVANESERRRWNNPGWAEVWPKRERLTDLVTPVLLRALALAPGERVLDIGSGAGAATLRAAEVVGPAGELVGVDISVPLAGLATRRAHDAAIAHVSFQAVDMQTGAAGGAPFDVAMSQFGVMFFDDPVAAFGNIRRQLVSGGRLGFACWQAPERNPWFFGSVLADLVAPPPAPEPGRSPTGPFTFADPDRIRSVLDAAGFVDVAITPREVTVEAPEDAVADDAQLEFMRVPVERMADARAVLDEHMETFRAGSGVCLFPLAYQVVTARDPGELAP